jgi:putative flippase GtrA
MSRTLFWFLVVGGAAALTHMLVFVLARDHLWPEVANAVGFVVAFGVSFVGHRWLSFQDAGTTVKQSLGRFAITALAGFATNEVVFVVVLRALAWPSLLALVLALLVAAGQTFVLSRLWAFRR